MLSALIIPASAADNDGMTFTSGTTYTVEKRPSLAPLTYEAVIKLPKDYTGRGGVIVGNFYNGSTKAVSFEVYENGIPRIYTISGDGKTVTNVSFSKTSIATGSYVHVALTIDAVSGSASFYINGVLSETKSVSTYTHEALVNNLVVGGDLRSGNAQYFKGEIKSVALYSDLRTADEVKSDYENSALDTSDSALIAAYDLTSSNKGHVKDLSANGNILINSSYGVEDLVALKGGLTFDANTRYLVRRSFDKAPSTFEAWVYLPQMFGDRGGVIIGNYDSGITCFSMEINTSGAPRLFYVDDDGDTHNIIFSKSDIRTGDWAHLAMTIDGTTNTAKCYINGVLAETKTDAPEIDGAAYINREFLLGGDMRYDNVRYFRGALKSVSVYSDVRTPEEIRTDMEAVSLDDENVMLHYDLSNVSDGGDVNDLSAAKRNAEYGEEWFSEKESVTDYAYSFCVVGDTQIVAYRDATNFHKIYDWIVANKESKKIEYVFGLGDITDKDTDSEWTLAKENINKLNGVVPYSVVRGNHDSINQINKYFADGTYQSQFNGFYSPGQMENSWRIFSVGETDYLLLTLDYGASDDVLKWAASVIETHLDHKVIITTHAYLYRDGTTLDQSEVCPPATNGGYNNGDHMWDKLVSKYENIMLVMSGHDPSNKVVVTQTKGEKGNTVTQMLIDPQGLDKNEADNNKSTSGMVTMLYFSEDGKTVTVETYSTIKDMYYRPDNQFSIDLSADGGDANDNGSSEGGTESGGNESGGNESGGNENDGNENDGGFTPDIDNNTGNGGAENGNVPEQKGEDTLPEDTVSDENTKSGLIGWVISLGAVGIAGVAVAAVVVVGVIVAVPVIIVIVKRKKK